MDIKLGWKALVIGAVLLMLIVGGIFWAVRRAEGRVEELMITIAVREAEIVKLNDQVEEAKKSSKKHKEEADQTQEELSSVETKLSGMRKRLKAEKNKPIPIDEEVVMLREQNALLEYARVLDKREKTSLRTALEVTEYALDRRTDQFNLSEQNNADLREIIKKVKRQQKLTNMGWGLGGAAIGFTGGALTSQFAF